MRALLVAAHYDPPRGRVLRVAITRGRVRDDANGLLAELGPEPAPPTAAAAVRL